MATDPLDHLLEMADGQRRHLEYQAVGPGHVVTLQHL
jgi:hypothetical protein